MSEPAYAAAKEVARANRAFYRAFGRLDPDAIRALWLDDASVQCVHPGGEMLSGPERVHASWRAICNATDALQVEIHDTAVHVEGDVGWATQVERVSTGPEQTDLLEAAATNVFRRVDGAWKLALHHASRIDLRFFPEG